MPMSSVNEEPLPKPVNASDGKIFSTDHSTPSRALVLAMSCHPLSDGPTVRRFDEYEQHLRESSVEKLAVPKEEVAELPPRFATHVPANELQNDGAIGSYRDDRESDSVHAIEYEDHWRIHIDSANPRFDHKKIDHLIEDASVSSLVFLCFAFLIFSNSI